MDAAGDGADLGAVATLRCSLCFAHDHHRAIFHLVMPEVAAPAVPALVPGVDESEDEENPEEPPFEDEAVGGGPAQPDVAADDFIPLPAADAVDAEDGEFFLPIVDAADFLVAPGQDSEAPTSDRAADSIDLQEPVRPDHVDVFMPFVDLRHFDHIAYAFINPTTIASIDDPTPSFSPGRGPWLRP
jgi:hypothetical protein